MKNETTEHSKFSIMIPPKEALIHLNILASLDNFIMLIT